MIKDCGVFSVVYLVCVQADEFAGSKVHFRFAKSQDSALSVNFANIVQHKMYA